MSRVTDDATSQDHDAVVRLEVSRANLVKNDREKSACWLLIWSLGVLSSACNLATVVALISHQTHRLVCLALPFALNSHYSSRHLLLKDVVFLGDGISSPSPNRICLPCGDEGGVRK